MNKTKEQNNSNTYKLFFFPKGAFAFSSDTHWTLFLVWGGGAPC